MRLSCRFDFTESSKLSCIFSSSFLQKFVAIFRDHMRVWISLYQRESPAPRPSQTATVRADRTGPRLRDWRVKDSRPTAASFQSTPVETLSDRSLEVRPGLFRL